MIRSFSLCLAMTVLIGCSDPSQSKKPEGKSGGQANKQQDMQQKLQSLKLQKTRLNSEINTLEAQADLLVSAGASAKKIGDNAKQIADKAAERFAVEKQILDLEFGK